MHLRKLILDNFKSHEHSVVSFAPGTNAICGKNKAGKTTIVQAIGLALFDFCSGKQKGYVRSGASAATLTVELVSAADDRPYEITRRIGSRASWEVRDPQTGLSVAVGTTDVRDWLCEHLGVPGETDLAALFEGAIGVPQGELTSAFTQPAVRRQAQFNTLLRIEEYRAAFEKMLSAANLAQTDVENTNVAIGSLEGETKALPEKVQEEATLLAVIVRVEKTQRRRARKIARLERMDGERTAAAEHLRRLDIRIGRLSQWEAGRNRDVKNSSKNHQEAQAAVQVVADNQAGYLAWEEAQKAFDCLQSQVKAGVPLANQKAEWEIKKTQGETRLAGLQTELEAVVNAEKEMARLAPLVTRQTECEHAAGEAQSALSEAKSDSRWAREGQGGSRDGHCPFLREPCRNVTAVGQTLIQFFDSRVAALEEAERRAEAELAEQNRVLAALGKSPVDPKTLFAIAKNGAEKCAALEKRMKDEREALNLYIREIATLVEKMAPFTALESQMEAFHLIMQTNAAAHGFSQINQALAAKLTAYALAEQRAQAALKRVQDALASRRQQHQSACDDCDPALHQRILAALKAACRLQDQAQGELKEKREGLEKLRGELVQLRRKVEELNEEKQKQKRMTAVLHHLNFVRTAIKNAGPPVTALLTARISREAHEIFRALMGDDTTGLRWETDYEITLLENGHERGLGTAAGSECVAAALAVRLALLQSMGEIRFAFFDEPTIHLDEERRDHLVERLLSLKSFTQLFVISHDDAFERDTNHVVRLEKQEGHSVVTTS